MKAKCRQSGLSLIEMTLVVASVALLTALSIPAARTLFNSLATSGDTKALISASLASARAIAAKEQRYAGIRFQTDLKGNQYIIFIVQDPALGAYFFRAVEGLQPIKLPGDIGVMDLNVRTDHRPNRWGAENTTYRVLNVVDLDDANPANIGFDGRNIYITDTTSFSIVFAPSGKLVIHEVRVRNREGDYQPDNQLGNQDKFSMDDIFNSPPNMANFNLGMFYQDDYAELGLGAEFGRSSFVIYDKTEFGVVSNNIRYNYLMRLNPVYINPYTGTIINSP